MTVYRMAEDGGANPYRRIRWIMVPINAILSALIIGISIYVQIIDVKIILVIAPIYFLLLTYGTYRYFRKFEKNWVSTEVEIGDDFIELRQKHKPSIRIQRDEISFATRKKGLTVHTANYFRSIHIPDRLVGYEEIISSLKDWALLKPPSLSNKVKLVTPPLMIIIGVLFVIRFSAPLWPVSVFLLMLLIPSIYFSWINYKRVDLSRREKLTSFLFHSVLFPVLLSFSGIAILYIFIK
jgi:hypothetical protein